MAFVPGRRRKKLTTQSKDAASCYHGQTVDNLEWLDESNAGEACLTQCKSLYSIPTDMGRKRKAFESNRNNDMLISPPRTVDERKFNVSMPNLLFLREIGLTGHGTHTRHYLFGGGSSIKSSLLRKPSPAPRMNSRHDPTSDNSDSQWIDYSPPIYRMQYFSNSSSASACLHKQVWRKKEIIPFSKLKTPLMDAILAIDRSGGYLIGISGHDLLRRRDESDDTSHPKLMLKFYGVPSPDRLHQFENSRTNRYLVSPLIHTVPLLLDNNESSTIEYLSPAQTPTQILFSDDQSLGVAFLRHANEICAWPTDDSPMDQDALGTIVIFEMPAIVHGRKSGSSRSYHCSNVRIGGWNSFTMRNCLWSTNIIPTTMSHHCIPKGRALCDSFRKVLSAYMLLNDEDDGFRISWITTSGIMPQQCTFVGSSCKIQPSRIDIISIPDDDVWEMKVVENSPTEDDTRLQVVFQAYLNVDALLSDVLDRRKHLSIFGRSPYQSACVRFMPEFCYNLVSIASDQMEVILVIVFSNREKMMHAANKVKVPSAMGIFVKLNLFDQSYDEIQWVCQYDNRPMKKWCMSLALNWRMREQGVGIFCVNKNNSNHSSCWLCETHEYNSDEDLKDDINVLLWSQYAQNAEKKSKLTTPKAISMSSLFPAADTVTNHAVLSAVPLTRMTSRHSPIEVVYG